MNPEENSSGALPSEIAGYSTKDLWRLQSEKKFQLGEEPSDAIFLMSPIALPGGMGHSVMEIPGGQRLWHKDEPVFYCGREIAQFVESEMEKRPRQVSPEGFAVPSSYPENVLVAARTRLSRRTGRNHSIPGGQRVTYWELRIKRIYTVRALWRGEDLSAEPNRDPYP
jgi:hypothetical protein